MSTHLNTRRQKTASVNDEVTANIAEYAVMKGINFKKAYELACLDYISVLNRIRGTGKNKI